MNITILNGMLSIGVASIFISIGAVFQEFSSCRTLFHMIIQNILELVLNWKWGIFRLKPEYYAHVTVVIDCVVEATLQHQGNLKPCTLKQDLVILQLKIVRLQLHCITMTLLLF